MDFIDHLVNLQEKFNSSVTTKAEGSVGTGIQDTVIQPEVQEKFQNPDDSISKDVGLGNPAETSSVNKRMLQEAESAGTSDKRPRLLRM